MVHFHAWPLASHAGVVRNGAVAGYMIPAASPIRWHRCYFLVYLQRADGTLFPGRKHRHGSTAVRGGRYVSPSDSVGGRSVTHGVSGHGGHDPDMGRTWEDNAPERRTGARVQPATHAHSEPVTTGGGRRRPAASLRAARVMGTPRRPRAHVPRVCHPGSHVHGRGVGARLADTGSPGDTVGATPAEGEIPAVWGVMRAERS